MATKRKVQSKPLRHRFVNLNIVVLSGHLTHDPELKVSKDGTPCMDFQLGVRSSGPKARAHFVQVAVFGQLALEAAKLRKGLPIVVEGEVRDAVYRFGRRTKIWARHIYRSTEDESLTDKPDGGTEMAQSPAPPRKRAPRRKASPPADEVAE